MVCAMQGIFREGHSWWMLSRKAYYIGFFCRVLSKKALSFPSVFGRTGGAMSPSNLVTPNMFYDRSSTFGKSYQFLKMCVFRQSQHHIKSCISQSILLSMVNPTNSTTFLEKSLQKNSVGMVVDKPG